MSRYIEADKVLKELRLNHNDVIYIDKRDTAKRIEKIKGIDIVRCEECKHYLFTDIDGYYCEHETYGQPCNYEPKDKPQTERSE